MVTSCFLGPMHSAIVAWSSLRSVMVFCIAGVHGAYARIVIHAHTFLPRSITPAVCWHLKVGDSHGGNGSMTNGCSMHASCPYCQVNLMSLLELAADGGFVLGVGLLLSQFGAIEVR
jgi:hypothetical protein